MFFFLLIYLFLSPNLFIYLFYLSMVIQSTGGTISLTLLHIRKVVFNSEAKQSSPHFDLCG